jgi:O-antigen/teichoic acid export membrane protein
MSADQAAVIRQAHFSAPGPLALAPPTSGVLSFASSCAGEVSGADGRGSSPCTVVSPRGLSDSSCSWGVFEGTRSSERVVAEVDADIGAISLELPRSPAAVFRRLRSHAARRMGWGLADQVMSSLSNFAVSIYVVHELGAVKFGAYSLAYVTYGFVLSASRGLATDPLIVRFSGTDLPTWRRAVADCTGTAMAVGLVIGACVLAAVPALSGAVGPAFLALGLTLPGLMLQDSWRYSFFALGRGSQAFINDTIWVVAVIPALIVVHMSGRAGVFWYVFAWGVTGNIAAAVGPWQARVVPKLAGVFRWVSEHRDLGPRYLAEGATQSAAAQLRAYIIGLILGLAALGSVQASATLLGPMTILFLGTSLVAIPEGARVLRRSPRHLPLFCLAVTGALSAAGLAWGLFLLVAVPRGFGSALLGPIWRSTYPLILPSTLGVIGQGVSGGAGTGLHALGAARRSLRLTILTSVLYVVGSVAGALAGGAAGTLWGVTACLWIGATLAWWQLRIAQREAGHLPAGHRFLSIRLSRPRRTGPVPATVPWPDLVLPVRRGRRPAAAARVRLATAGLALLAVLAATGWTLEHRLHGTHPAAGAHAAATGASAGTNAGPAPVITPPHERAKVLKPVSAASFDPYGNGLGENNQLAYLAIDGNPATAWHTDWYTSASFGGLKPGTGLLLDMGRTVTISTVQVLLGSLPGADFQVSVGAVASSLTGLPPVAQASDAGGQVSLHLTSPARGRYVLIWFTQLPPADSSSGTFQASVYNVTIEGWA